MQFPVNDRETNGGTRVREVVIKPMGATGNDVPNLRITVWPDFEEVEIGEGDLVAADGKFTTNTNGGKTYYNLSATALNVNGKKVGKVTDGVENSVQEEDEDFDPGF